MYVDNEIIYFLYFLGGVLFTFLLLPVVLHISSICKKRLKYKSGLSDEEYRKYQDYLDSQ